MEELMSKNSSLLDIDLRFDKIETKNGILVMSGNPITKLIAAAPEMYDALKNWIDWYDRNDATENIEDKLIHSARVALRKANGNLP